MLKQFFAQYLFNRGLLEKKQIIDILDSDVVLRVAPGIIAIQQGYMTAKEVELVQQVQINEDKLFTDAAVEKGFLTAQQVEQINAAREDVTLSFMQSIVDNGYMSLENLQNALEEYRRVNGETVEIDSADKLSVAQENAELYGKYLNAFLGGMKKFMDIEGAVIETAELDCNNKWLISQTINGDITIGTGIMVDEDALYNLAAVYAHEDIDSAGEEMAVDSLAEFLNVINGLVIVALSNNKIDADLMPQKTGCNVMPSGSNQVHVNITTKLGELQLILAADALQ